jgi:predicted membrane protein
MDRNEWEDRWNRREEWRRWRAERRYRRNPAGRVILGLSMIAFGVVFILGNLGIIDVRDIRDYWPVILIVLGGSHLLSWRRGSPPIGGLILTTLGVLFLLRNFGYIYGNIWQLIWPVLLIGWGAMMLVARPFWHDGRFSSAGGSGSGTTLEPVVNEYVIFGGVKRKVETQEFQGGRAEAVFGGVELDLRRAGIKDNGEAVLDASATFGGVEIRVPETWDVTVTGGGIFGGYEDKTSHGSLVQGTRPKLVVRGHAVFGGVEVKN